MFSGRHQLLKNGSGHFFIDRDPDVFTLVITYLRNGLRIPEIKDEFLRERFNMELDHWLLPAQGNKENTRFQNTSKLR